MKHICSVAALLLLVVLFSGSPAQAAVRIYVRGGPPVAVIEHHPAHRAGYAWHPGYHRWDGHRYVWTRGAWVRPPYRRATYVSGRWEHARRGWYWVPGHWARR
jgi:hypothetical protein